MDIRKLSIFQEVVRSGSFTQAAKTLFMTQPAVSKAVSELEKEAGTPLFERYPKQAVLTPAGKRLLQKSRPLLELYQEVERELSTLNSHARLRIGSSITIANHQLTRLLKELKKAYPSLELQVEVASAALILKKLEENQLDAAFLEGVFSSSQMVSIPFSSYRIHAVCAPDFLEKQQEKLLPDSSTGSIPYPSSLGDLARFPLLLREKGSAIRDTVDSAFLLEDLVIAPSWVSSNSNALLQAAAEGFGIAFLPENMIQKKLRSKELIELTLPVLPFCNQNHFVYKKHKHLNEPLQKLLELALSS